jgi:DNA-binding transcriptional LysR family regulator
VPVDALQIADDYLETGSLLLGLSKRPAQIVDAAATAHRYETAPVTVDNAAVLHGFAQLGQGVALLPQWLV